MVRSAPRSEPPAGSLNSMHQISSAARAGARKRSRWAGVPWVSRLWAQLLMATGLTKLGAVTPARFISSSMISCSSADAASPQGLGQCGVA